MKNYILNEMDKIGANGVSFVSIAFPNDRSVYGSYTREEIKNGVAIPKTNRIYWKKIGSETKYYINEEWQELSQYKGSQQKNYKYFVR